MSLALGPLRQVALACRDLRETVEFYRDRLGLVLMAQFSAPGLVFFKLGDTRLLIERHEGPTASGGVLYFAVDDIESAQAELEGRGVHFDSRPHLIHRDDTGSFGPAGGEEWMSFFKDPTGNVLALAERRAPAR